MIQSRACPFALLRRRDGDAVRSVRLARRARVHRRRRRLAAVERAQPVDGDALDVAADAAFAEAERHPRLEARDDARLHLRMLVQVVVQGVRPGLHERLEPRRARRVSPLHLGGVDVEAGAQVAVERAFAFGLREAADRGQVVRLDAVEVVLGLRVDDAEYGVRVGAAVHVGNAPVVAGDRHGLRPLLPACKVGLRAAGRGSTGGERHRDEDEQ